MHPIVQRVATAFFSLCLALIAVAILAILIGLVIRAVVFALDLAGYCNG